MTGAARLLVQPAPAGRQRQRRRHGVETFPLSQVRLLDGPFKRSEALNVAYVTPSTSIACWRRSGSRPG